MEDKRLRESLAKKDHQFRLVDQHKRRRRQIVLLDDRRHALRPSAVTKLPPASQFTLHAARESSQLSAGDGRIVDQMKLGPVKRFGRAAARDNPWATIVAQG